MVVERGFGDDLERPAPPTPHRAKSERNTTSSYPLIMTEGGDDRLLLNSEGINKYHCCPEPIKDALFRGSCTCNVPTEEAYGAAEATYQSLTRNEVIYLFRCFDESILTDVPIFRSVLVMLWKGYGLESNCFIKFLREQRSFCVHRAVMRSTFHFSL
jgi:hypothetical protein